MIEMMDYGEIEVPSEPITQPEMPVIDQELICIAKILEILAPCGPLTKRRMLDYIAHRVGAA